MRHICITCLGLHRVPFCFLVMESWDDRYSKGKYPTDGPHRLLIGIVKTVEPGTALDLACGAGRNAVFLAQQGWSVTGVDYSEVGIELARAKALGSGLKVDFRIADLEKGGFQIIEDHYDLICSFCYLQNDLFERMKKGVRPGGLIISSTLSYAKNEKPRRFALGLGELRRRFEDFEILHFQESSGDEKKDAGGRNRRTSEIIARRPFN